MLTKQDIDVMDPEGVIDDPAFLDMSAQAQSLARFSAAVLMKHYEGWRWAITVDERGGVVHVFNLDLSGDLGYTLMYDDIYNLGNVDWKLILVAGGEILERYGLPTKAKTPDWKDYVTWVAGTPIPDVSDKKRGLVKYFARRLTNAAKQVLAGL